MPLAISKTPHRNPHLASLAKVNDQLCFYLFADAELTTQLLAGADKHKDDYTSQVFPENGYARRIHVTMSELISFQIQQLNQMLGMNFAFGVEQLLLYIENTLDFWGKTNSVTVCITEPIEECLEQFSKTNATVPLASSVLKTLKYLRLRRNHFIHAGENLSSEMIKFLKHDAKRLQNHWSTKTNILGMSFTTTDIRCFTPDECITLIKLMRVCIEEIDTYVASHVNAGTVIRFLDKQLLERLPELRVISDATIERRVRKIKKMAQGLYGIKATNKEIYDAIVVTI
jgi:hypothetical protein